MVKIREFLGNFQVIFYVDFNLKMQSFLTAQIQLFFGTVKCRLEKLKKTFSSESKKKTVTVAIGKSQRSYCCLYCNQRIVK